MSFLELGKIGEEIDVEDNGKFCFCYVKRGMFERYLDGGVR